MATKCVGRTGPPPGTGASSKHILDAVEASLRRWGPTRSTLSAAPTTPTRRLTSARRPRRPRASGKVRYIGCTNFLAYQLARAVGRSETRGLVRFDRVQPRYNLLFRQIDRDSRSSPWRKARDHPLQPHRRRPLLREAPGRRRVGGHALSSGNAGPMYQDRYWHEGEFATVEASARSPPRRGHTHDTLGGVGPGQPRHHLAHRRCQPTGQLDDSLAAAEYKLDPDLKRQMDELTYKYRLGDAAR